MIDRILILLSSARELFERGQREAAIACFSQASKDIDAVSDPLAFLSLSKKIDTITKRYILTKV